MKRSFYHRQFIPCAPEQVWAALIQIEDWGRWNTLTARAPEGLEAGRRLKLVLQVGGRRLPVQAVLTEVRAGQALVWKGGVKGLFHAVHGFRLNRSGEGTFVEHFEDFQGALVRPTFAWIARNQEQTYGSVNARLAAFCLDRTSVQTGKPPSET